MICLDASLVLAWLLPEALSPQARFMKEKWEQAAEQLVSPTFLQLEVVSVLRNHVFRGNLTVDEGEEALETFSRLPIDYFPMERFVILAWEAAKRLNAPRAYDMVYFALAEASSCDLWTGDRRLARLVGLRYDWVRWTGDVAI